MNEADYGNYHLRKLKAAMQRTAQPIPREVQTAVAEVLRFLDRRLTDAAKAGCHHCDEGERGTPCRWCGLKTNRRL